MNKNQAAQDFARQLADAVLQQEVGSLDQIVLNLRNYAMAQRDNFPAVADMVEAALELIKAERVF